MLNVNETKGIHLICGITDLRKSVDGLASIIHERLQLNIFSNHLFIFCNRTKDKIKVLHFEKNGFWIYYRRLETGRFKWPNRGEISEIDINELKLLLDGFDLIKHQKGHEKIKTKSVY